MGNVTVLLIEAGTVFGPLSIVPLLTTFQQNTTVDWSFRTVPQRYSSAGFVNRQQLLPRGKGLGGSSQLNYMLHYSDDIGKEFDKWETFVGSQWGQENLMKYLSESSSEVCVGCRSTTKEGTFKINVSILLQNLLEHFSLYC